VDPLNICSICSLFRHSINTRNFGVSSATGGGWHFQKRHSVTLCDRKIDFIQQFFEENGNQINVFNTNYSSTFSKNEPPNPLKIAKFLWQNSLKFMYVTARRCHIRILKRPKTGLALFE
jgi:hypothetical protein